MLLTAQRVEKAAREQGINAFCNLHGPYDWIEPPPGIPENNPGQRVNQSIQVSPGGNRVRSYLDIIAPDETPTTEILAAVPRFLESVRATPLPWSGRIGRCTFRFGIELGLLSQWPAEFRALLHAAVLVRVPA